MNEMDLKNLDAELNVKIIEAIKEILKNIDIKILFDVPNKEVLEASTLLLNDTHFKLIKGLVISEIDDLNPRYLKFIRKKLLNNTRELSQPQAIDYIKKRTKHLFFLKPFLGKKLIKTEISTLIYRINYNNVIIDITKLDYDRLNYYTKYVYKLQQLYKLNHILGINEKFNVVFDDDNIAKEMYNSMYDKFKDILKPPKD